MKTVTFRRTYPGLGERTVEIINVSIDTTHGTYIPDKEGIHLGFVHPDTEEVMRFYRDPAIDGVIKEYKDEPEIDRLVAEDVTVTPEGLNLGEEE